MLSQMNLGMNPFDLNLSRAYNTPEAFCPRPDLETVLAHSTAGCVWNLIDGDRRSEQRLTEIRGWHRSPSRELSRSASAGYR
jgi:hypothetical protein